MPEAVSADALARRSGLIDMIREYSSRRTALLVAGAAALACTGLWPGPVSLALAGPGPNHNHSHHGSEGSDSHGALPAPNGGGHKGSPSTEGGAHAHDDAEGVIRLSQEQIESSGVTTVRVGPGAISHVIAAPGVIAIDRDRMARVAAKVTGTVSALNKRLGDEVLAGETVAILDSREVAEARSEYFAALTNLELQKTLFEREQALWDRRVSAEQQYLRSRNALREVELRLALAVQKLAALGLEAPSDQMTAGKAPQELKHYPLRSPIGGHVVDRRVDLGAPVGGDGQEKEIYVIADLSQVWIDLAVSPVNLSLIQNNQTVHVAAQDGAAGVGTIIFVSPVLNPETRAARVIARLDNAPFRWRPGASVAARIITGSEPAALVIPSSAIQTINNRPVVFTRSPEGFRLREIKTGAADATQVAVTSGLQPGDEIAVGNVFVLKAELGKAEAEHAH